MDVREAVKLNIDMANYVCMQMLGDLSDADLMRRPCVGCNHLNWQVGHLILSEHEMMNAAFPGSMPELPSGFAPKYAKEAATIDDPKKFCTKAELMAAFEPQRAAMLANLESTSTGDFDKPSGLDYAPTLGSLFSLQGSHWMMHCGQWAVVRRQLGHPPLL